jgi:hypothetical protein
MGRVDELANRIADAETEIVRLSDAANAGPSNAGADPAAVKALESRLSTLAGSTAKMTGEIDALSGRVTALEDKVSANAEAQTGFQQKENAARILAGNALRDAYHRGIPFADLLQSLEKITGDSPAIAALKADAARGVASDDELKRRFADLTGAILSASAPKQEGVVNRLIANARSLVEIRPAGPVEGDTPQAIVSRIEADLDSGTLEAALAEWQALPEAARAASQDWADRLKARIAADKALDQVLAGLGLPAEKSR